MAISVDYTDDADFYRIFCIISDSFGNDQPYIDLMFPNHHEHAGRVQGAERLLQMKKTDSTTKFLKATDTTTGEIIGQAKWIIFANGKPEESPLTGDFWGSKDEKDLAAHVYAGYLEPRRKTARSANGPLVSLDILTIDPKHQHRGAGAKLMEWGVRLADELGAEMCVESSVFAKHLYEQNGFRVTDNVEVYVPPRWSDKIEIEFEFMRRAVTSEASRTISKEALNES